MSRHDESPTHPPDGFQIIAQSSGSIGPWKRGDLMEWCENDGWVLSSGYNAGDGKTYAGRTEWFGGEICKPSALTTQVGGSHYKDLPIQPVEFIQKNQLNFCEGAAIKYVCRHRNKNGRQDIEKAIHFLQLLLEIEYPEKFGHDCNAVK